MAEPVAPVAADTAVPDVVTPATVRLGHAVEGMVQAARVAPQALGKHGVDAARAVADVVNAARSLNVAPDDCAEPALAIGTAVDSLQREQQPAAMVAHAKAMAQQVPLLVKAVISACAGVPEGGCRSR